MKNQIHKTDALCAVMYQTNITIANAKVSKAPSKTNMMEMYKLL